MSSKNTAVAHTLAMAAMIWTRGKRQRLRENVTKEGAMKGLAINYKKTECIAVSQIDSQMF